MPAPLFDFAIGKMLSRKLDEALPATRRIEDRVTRTDLENEVRYAGTLLATLYAAERALRGAPSAPAIAGAMSTYLEKLERAEGAVSSVHERVMAAVTGAEQAS